MTLQKVDHKSVGVSQLSSKTHQPNMIKLVEIFLEEALKLEQAMIDLAEVKNISTAVGVWLDYIGAVVGLPREGLTDEAYREALRFKINVNTANGTVKSIINLVSTYTESVTVSFTESGIAYGQLYLDGTKSVDKTLFELINEIRPAGVRVAIHTDITGNAFQPAFETNESSVEDLQITLDGTLFENIEVTLDGVNFTPLFITTSTEIQYYNPDVSKANFYYEEGSPLEITLDGVNYTNLLVDTNEDTDTDLRVITPYNLDYIPEDITPLTWEMTEDIRST